MYRLQHLATVRAVVRTGSFALAARELGYTASAVSQQVAALERDTGLTLFEREAHAVRTTAAGHRIAELARGILAGVEDLRAEADRLVAGHSGRLRLGAFPTAGERVVPAALAAFATGHPDVEVALSEGEPPALVDLLLDGELDLALVYEYAACPRPRPGPLAGVPLLHEDLLLLHPADGRDPVGLAGCTDRRWIASGPESDGAVSLLRLCAAAGFAPRVVHRSDDYDVVRELVVAVAGVAVVPALGHRPDPRITATALSGGAARRTVHLLRRRGGSDPLLPVFGDALRRAVPVGPHVTAAVPAPSRRAAPATPPR
ncbi:LysR family transcriptional regulator [Pseudonocardia alni]|uniref:LysR family transcriptional regulator n=1 Tax=Pseudonocardia alni TaxID=33907 RepID=UPI00331D0947